MVDVPRRLVQYFFTRDICRSGITNRSAQRRCPKAYSHTDTDIVFCEIGIARCVTIRHSFERIQLWT
jgi:hypothetical protein